jgi:hypothetical protein
MPGTDRNSLVLVMQIAAEDLLFAPGTTDRAADVDIVLANKTQTGDFEFRVTRATLTTPNGSGAGAATRSEQTASMPLLVRHTTHWNIKSDTTAIVLIVRDRATGRYGTLEMPVNRIPAGSAVNR